MKIHELQLDKKNANKGTKRGQKAIVASLENYGAGRSILIDKNGKVIAGNHVVASAQAAGISDVEVIQSDGSKIIAVQRTDLDLDDPKARELAIADNRASELGLAWNPEMLADGDLNLLAFFNPAELSEMFCDGLANDVNAEYEGMPEYSAEDEMGVRRLIVHFRTYEDVKEFAKVIGQSFSEKAKFVWFPKDERADLAHSKYV
jgi:ParB-like chromosome segregation protein Spo0J